MVSEINAHNAFAGLPDSSHSMSRSVARRSTIAVFILYFQCVCFSWFVLPLLKKRPNYSHIVMAHLYIMTRSDASSLLKIYPWRVFLLRPLFALTERTRRQSRRAQRLFEQCLSIKRHYRSRRWTRSVTRSRARR